MSTPKAERTLSRPLLYAVAVAALVRLAAFVYAERAGAAFDFPDARRYLAVARNIADGRGPIESDQVRCGTDPLYPLLLSAGYRCGLESREAMDRFARAMNLIFALAGVLLAGSIGARRLGPAVGTLAAWMMALDPLQVVFSAFVLTETMATMLLLAALTAMARPGLGSSIAAGAFMAALAVARSSQLLLIWGMAPLVWHFSARSTRPRLAATAGYLLAAGLVLAPTALRNHRLLGSFVPVRTGGGASLMEALGPWADGGPGMERIVYPPGWHDADEYQRDRLCRRAAWDWAKANPTLALRLACVKLRRTWSATLNAPAFDRPLTRWACGLTTVPVYLLALAGVWRLRRRPGWLALFLTPIAYVTLVHAVFVGSVRYRIPVMPLVFLLAAGGLCAIGSRVTGKREAPEFDA